ANKSTTHTEKIIFFEDRNFKGHSYEWTSDCSDMAPFLARCHSCRVESGCWMVYDRPNFMGNQYFVRRGEYADYMSMWGMSEWVKSCRLIPMHRGPYRTRIYGRENFMGQMMEIMDDCDSVTERYHWSSGFMSCHVLDGHWLLYEMPHYKGRMWYFQPGEYRNFREMVGTGSMRFMSMRRILDCWY
uniref:Beta/gamma crystallin 'Greek key' domain-containing protein n=1 Tax=Electrophorus electricus TaxID=8005 RepID=A0A4W4EB47_ELEEL